MKRSSQAEYFPFVIPVAQRLWNELELGSATATIRERRLPAIMFFRELAVRLTRQLPAGSVPVQAGMLNLYALQGRIFRYIIRRYTEEQCPGILESALADAGFPCGSPALFSVAERFCAFFPGNELLFGAVQSPVDWLLADDAAHGRKRQVATELLLLRLAAENRALDPFRPILDDRELAATSSYPQVVGGVERQLAAAPAVEPFEFTLPELLRLPLLAAPDSLYDQLEFIRTRWRAVLPEELLVEIQSAFAVVQEESRIFAPRGEPGGAPVLEFGPGRGGVNDYYPEPELFSADVDWMPNVVLIAKMVYVWLGQLSLQYGREITRLDQIPDAELDRLARWGVTGLWLIGLWERSPASQKIKQITGNPEAISSAYSLFDYAIAADLGGEAALWNLRDRALKRGIRLASDMVPNHTGIYSKWTVEHPDWFVQLDYPPYPTYSFGGPDLSFAPEVSLHIEDGYWDRTEAAVVFKHYDHRDGRTRYIYHGNDGTSTPWNDTAQLNYLNPEVREAVINTILHVARMFPIIRFDAAMTLAKRHFQRLWFPQPGHGGIPSRAEHGMTREEFDAAMPEEFWRQVVDRVAAEASDTLLLAEAFWLMEGYFVRTLGMHRVYNSAFMNMLKMEENAKYRQTVKNVLEFNPQVLQRFVNFMNNPDEKTAVEQFGKENKYFGACVLLVTMPGLPMIGHGQVEGFHEKYGMEYKRAYWNEAVDEHLVREHEWRVFPLMRRRWLFSGAENFVFYDFWSEGHVNEDVFAYSNRSGDQRGIIAYHNRFASTSGWIRSSTSFAAKNAAGETELRQTTLGHALGFKGDGRHYYLFRDYASGLEYIRNGRELCEQGLFVAMEAYEYHAYLDFREIWDDEYGTWGKLCHQLQGGGVPSMNEEVKQVRFAALIDLARGLLDRHHGLLTGDFGELDAAGMKAARTAFGDDLAAFMAALAEQAELTDAAPLPLAQAVLKELSFLEGLCSAKGAQAETLTGYTARLLAFAWLSLHRCGELEGPEEMAAASAELVTTYGLFRPLQEELYAEGGGKDDPLAALDVPSLVNLFLVLLHWQELLTLPATDQEEWLDELLSDREAAAFIGRHASGGFDWFIKERWELLVSWLALTALVSEAGAAKSGKVPAARKKAIDTVQKALTARAAAAGYRVDRFLAGLGNGGHGEP
ncbi:MAG: alpha-amylase [Geobacter sp.]|nr:alpha-amylase [Geobacter sp.]